MKPLRFGQAHDFVRLSVSFGYGPIDKWLAAFEGAVESPFTVASWFRTPQPLLDGRTPAEWLVAGEDTARLGHAARRTAAQLRG